jgi:hypothetical protein
MTKTNYIFDVAKISSKFETPSKARLWQQRTICTLCIGTAYDAATVENCPSFARKISPSLELAYNLNEDLNGQTYKSGASRLYMRGFRRRYVDQVKNCLDNNLSCFHVVLVPSDSEYQISSGDLHTLDVRRLKTLLVKRLERALKVGGLEHVIILGGLDLSFNEETESSGNRWPSFWQPHWDFIVQGCSREELKRALKSAFPASRKVPRPFRIEQVKETPEDYARVISYGLKAVFFRRVSYIGIRSKTKPDQKCFRTRICPLKPKEQRELALFLDRVPVMQRLFLRGVRRHGKRLIKL